MPSVAWNRKAWGEQHVWNEDGDEWNGMAAHCRQPYRDWKAGLIEAFLAPGAAGGRIVEIGPGHGRWTEHLLAQGKSVWIVDVTEECLDYCAERFGPDAALRTHLTDGSALGPIADGSVDFVWSFDVFVHIEPADIAGYLGEFRRVLAPGGTAVIHHAGKPDWSLSLSPVTRRAGRPGRIAQRLVSQRRWRDSGNRSDVSPESFARMARAAGLAVVEQRTSWGPQGRYTVDKYGDHITVLRRPAD